MLKGIFDDVLPDQLRDGNHVMYGPPSHNYGLTVDSSPKYTNTNVNYFRDPTKKIHVSLGSIIYIVV